MGLGNFSVDTAVVARYLEAVERELKSLFLLVLRLTMEAETPPSRCISAIPTCRWR